MGSGADGRDEQAEVNKLLWRGKVYSIIWLAGFGSAVALHAGLKARRMIKSNPSLQGAKQAWSCIIAGGIGFAILCAAVAIGIFNALSQP
jgi:hypothetical protein